jgi:hypothetical protein
MIKKHSIPQGFSTQRPTVVMLTLAQLPTTDTSTDPHCFSWKQSNPVLQGLPCAGKAPSAWPAATAMGSTRSKHEGIPRVRPPPRSRSRLSTARSDGTADVAATACTPARSFHGRIRHAACGASGRCWIVGTLHPATAFFVRAVGGAAVELCPQVLPPPRCHAACRPAGDAGV